MLFAMSEKPSAPADPSSPLLVARVQLEDAAALELDYVVPDRLRDRVSVGTRVIVPLQRQRVAAVVLELLDHNAHGYRLKEIADLKGRGDPVFTPALLKLARWAAEYYVCPVQQVLRAMLPKAVRASPESFITDSHLTLVKKPNADEIEKLKPFPV